MKNNGTVFKQKNCRLELFCLSLCSSETAFYIMAYDYNFLLTCTGSVIEIVVFVLSPIEHHELLRSWSHESALKPILYFYITPEIVWSQCKEAHEAENKSLMQRKSLLIYPVFGSLD